MWARLSKVRFRKQRAPHQTPKTHALAHALAQALEHALTQALEHALDEGAQAPLGRNVATAGGLGHTVHWCHGGTASVK